VRAANLAPWRNRNAAVCKTAMSRGSTGWGFQNALVDQLDGQPSSKRPYAGSSPVERAIIAHGRRFESCRDQHLESWPSGKATWR
jgi:hypothetical protein